MSETKSENAALVELTADIASAYVSNNAVATSDVPSLIKTIFAALNSAGEAPEKPIAPLIPAVSIKKSVTDGYLICLDDGRQFKSLKRHLRTKYNLSPDAYRAKWGLPKDYPMVAPAYAAARSNLAKQMGLGQGGRGAAKIAAATKSPRKARAAKA